jgi:hypothetical protein
VHYILIILGMSSIYFFDHTSDPDCVNRDLEETNLCEPPVQQSPCRRCTETKIGLDGSKVELVYKYPCQLHCTICRTCTFDDKRCCVHHSTNTSNPWVKPVKK